MTLRTTLQKLIRRDPGAALRERATELRGSLSRRTVMAATAVAAVTLPTQAAAPAHGSTEYAGHRDRLLAAYDEDRACRPIDGTAEINTLEYEACKLVQSRCWSLASEVAALPPPRTLDGLAVIALAAAIQWEVSHSDEAHHRAAVDLIRSILAFTGTNLPPGFSGFGDEDDVMERDRALYAAPGSLPAWAIAEAKAEFAFDDA